MQSLQEALEAPASRQVLRFLKRYARARKRALEQQARKEQDVSVERLHRLHGQADAWEELTRELGGRLQSSPIAWLDLIEKWEDNDYGEIN